MHQIHSVCMLNSQVVSINIKNILCEHCTDMDRCSCGQYGSLETHGACLETSSKANLGLAAEHLAHVPHVHSFMAASMVSEAGLRRGIQKYVHSNGKRQYKRQQFRQQAKLYTEK